MIKDALMISVEEVDLGDDAVPPIAASPGAAPRRWDMMLVTWTELCFALATIVGLVPISEVAFIVSAAEDKFDLHLRAWRWMWALQPCSEARKAAFTLGMAAWLIDRWRRECMHQRLGVIDIRLGQRAESALRIMRWHLGDARGEQASIRSGEPPTIPSWERVWTSGDGMVQDIIEEDLSKKEGGRLVALGAEETWPKLIADFKETAIASLPDGPWVMTTRDVERFLEMLRERL